MVGVITNHININNKTEKFGTMITLTIEEIIKKSHGRINHRI